MPIEAFGLALAAAFYPPAIVAMIAVARGEHVRRRVVAYLAGAATMTFGAGAAILLLLDGAGVVQRRRPAPGAALEIALGITALLLAVWLWRTRELGTCDGDERGESRTERLTRRLALVFLLGFVMYAPSPLYFGAVKAVADAGLSTAANATTVVMLGAVVLLMAEVPAACVVVAPERATPVLVAANSWLRRNARRIGAVVFAAGGAYLLLRGFAHAE